MKFETTHDFENKGSLQWTELGLPRTEARTLYECKKCGIKFYHFYNRTSSIMKAMEIAGISSVCDKEPLLKIVS